MMILRSYHALDDALGGHKELVETLLAARCDAMQGDGGATEKNMVGNDGKMMGDH